MRNKNKILSGILALSAVACVSLGIAFQSDDAVNASAADSTMSVNTLGYLEWAKVDGATSYQVSSDYGTFTVTENRANVGDAITRAAKDAYAQDENATSTTVDFTVTPYTDSVAGASSTYTHTVENYIDYGFSKTDLSETKNAEGVVLGASVSIQTAAANNGTNGVYDAISKNDLCTFTWNTAASISTSTTLNEWIYLFGKDDCTWENTANSYYVWALRLRSTGVRVYLNGTGNSAKTVATNETWTVLGDVMTFGNDKQFVTGVDYKFSVGVFDTYGVNGTKTGETIYVRIDNATDQKLIRENYMFVSNEDLTTSGVTEEDYNNASGLGICGHSANYVATIKSGNAYDATYGAPLYQAQNLSLSLNGDIGVNMYADLNDVAKLNSDVAEMQITYKGKTTTQDVPAVETGDMAGLYKFSYAVAPKEIDEEITARLVIPGGPVGAQVTYTVRDWVNAVKSAYETDNQTYAKNYAMATALENYCDTAVTYFDTTAEQPEKNDTVVDFSEFAPTSTAWSGSVTLSGISLLAEANTTLRIYFKVDGAMPTVKVNGQEVTPETLVQGEDTFYYVEMTDIAAKDLDKAYTFEFDEDNVSCSALTYGCTLTESSDAKSVNLVKALYAYNQVANTYFAQ